MGWISCPKSQPSMTRSRNLVADELNLLLISWVCIVGPQKGTYDDTSSWESLMHIKKSNILINVPWMTPKPASTLSDLAPSILTHCDMSLRNEVNQVFLILILIDTPQIRRRSNTWCEFFFSHSEIASAEGPCVALHWPPSISHQGIGQACLWILLVFFSF